MSKLKVSVFVDGANFFSMQKDSLLWFADPKKILDYLEQFGEIVDAYYYVGWDSAIDPKQQGFYDALPGMGYTLVTKQIKTIFDNRSGYTKRKANLDIEIVLDMFNTIEHYDMAILISGDSDFERALQFLRVRGKKFLIIATDTHMSRELRNVAGRHYIRFEDIRSEVERVSEPHMNS